MFIRIPGAEFKVSLLELIQGNQKTSINFCLIGNVLHLQTSGTLIDEKQLVLKEYDSQDTTEITVNIEQTINLINPKEAVIINVRGDIMEIKQNSFEFVATRTPEQRVESTLDTTQSKPFDNFGLIRFISDSKSLDGVAKTLSLGLAPIIVFDNIAYLYYSNTVYSTRVKLPDCSIPSEVARKLSNVLMRSKSCSYVHDAENGVLTINISNSETVTIMTQKTNKQLVQGIKNVLVNLRDVATISLRNYKEYMNIICKAYKKLLLELTICEDGIQLHVDNVTTKFNIGSKGKSLVSIKISTEQLSAISRLFGEEIDVVVKKGDNCICLMQKNSEKKLVLAGMLY